MNRLDVERLANVNPRLLIGKKFKHLKSGSEYTIIDYQSVGIIVVRSNNGHVYHDPLSMFLDDIRNRPDRYLFEVNWVHDDIFAWNSCNIKRSL